MLFWNSNNDDKKKSNLHYLFFSDSLFWHFKVQKKIRKMFVQNVVSSENFTTLSELMLSFSFPLSRSSLIPDLAINFSTSRLSPSLFPSFFINHSWSVVVFLFHVTNTKFFSVQYYISMEQNESIESKLNM